MELTIDHAHGVMEIVNSVVEWVAVLRDSWIPTARSHSMAIATPHLKPFDCRKWLDTNRCVPGHWVALATHGFGTRYTTYY